VQGKVTLSFEEAEKEVFEALSSGRCFVSNYRGGDGKGFRFWAEGNGQEFSMGSRIHNVGKFLFKVESPLNGDIRLLRDGQIVKRFKGKRLTYQGEGKGVYRVEIFRKKRGWIYSNPIVVV